MSDYLIATADPRRPDAAALVRELDRHMADLYPAESNHLLDLDALAAPDVRFLIARRAGDGRAVGCAALKLHGEGYGEVKRMFVAPSERGLGLGRRLLERVEAEARAAGLGLLRLETGVAQPEALGLYRAAGYRERGPFGGYGPDPLSVFMEKALG
jgi:putative acetyltransferase